MKNFLNRFFAVNLSPAWVILLVDLGLVVVSCVMGYGLRYSFRSLLYGGNIGLSLTVLCTVSLNLVAFRVYHTYANVIRYSSFVDILQIVVALSLAYGTMILISLFPIELLSPRIYISTTVIFIAYFINLAFVICVRTFVKLLYEYLMLDRTQNHNVFVYGAKDIGSNIANTLRADTKRQYTLAGFLTDDAHLANKRLMGTRVYINDEHAIPIMKSMDVRYLIVPPDKLDINLHKEILNRLMESGIQLLTIREPLGMDSEQKGGELQDMQIEDLLGRESIQVDVAKIARHLEGKRVLVTGAAGSIGSELVRQICLFQPAFIALVDQAETPLHDMRVELRENWQCINTSTIVADVSNLARMEVIFDKVQPQYVFHAAAYKHVPMMEDNASESIQVNVLGTKTVADLSLKYGVEKFVMISTDKAVNPTNVMGCSKRLAEIYVQSLALHLQKTGQVSTKFITTRFGNVLGSNGSVIPRFHRQIKSGGPVTVTHPEIIRYFMTIPEACRLVLEAGCMGQGGEIYIFDMGEPVKIVDLAKRMIWLSGQRNIKIEFTGLRHGEKLYEELLNNKELTIPTYHEKIMIAKVREYDFEVVNQDIQKLIDLSYTSDSMRIVAQMKVIVPEFISAHSDFEALDKCRYHQKTEQITV